MENISQNATKLYPEEIDRYRHKGNILRPWINQKYISWFAVLDVSYPLLHFERDYTLAQGPLLLDGLLGPEMTSFLKIKIFFKSSYGVSVKVHISHQEKFCKDMFIHFRFIVKICMKLKGMK